MTKKLCLRLMLVAAFAFSFHSCRTDEISTASEEVQKEKIAFLKSLKRM